MMKKHLIFLLCLWQSCYSPAQDNTLCEKYNNSSAKLVFEFEMEGDSTKLDTALWQVDSALLICPPQKNGNLMGRKLSILSLQHNYDAGIEYVKTLPDPFMPDFPYYNSVLLKRFQAMKSLHGGDSAQFVLYVDSILEEMDPFFTAKQPLFDDLLKKDMDTILKNPLSFLHMQYYYYKLIIEDPVLFRDELEELQEKGYNPEYIQFIGSGVDEEGFREDFLIFRGW